MSDALETKRAPETKRVQQMKEVSAAPVFNLGLTGYPLEHSLSPRLHQAALQALGLSGTYACYPVTPQQVGEAIPSLLQRLRAGELHGLNVTIPYKQTVLPWLDGLTPEARAIGAVNTIFLQGQRLVGDNTDAAGFLADLERVSGGIFDPETGAPRRALVLGAGGAARAVVYALLRTGWQVSIATRRLEQAQTLANSLHVHNLGGVRPVEILPLLPEALRLTPASDLVVNATPLGMFPRVEGTPWPEDVPFPQGSLFYDLVYNPVETRLVRQARRLGLKASTGLGMLVEQAALAFERWTGQSPPRQAMIAAVHLTRSEQ